MFKNRINTIAPKIIPGAIGTLIRQFCATFAPNTMQERAGPDYTGHRVWGPQHNVKNLAI